MIKENKFNELHSGVRKKHKFNNNKQVDSQGGKTSSF